MRDFFKRNTPPGMELEQEWRVFLVGNIGAVLVSFFAFIDKYLEARNQLFIYENGERVRLEGAIIVPFHRLLSVYFSGFLIVAGFMLVFIVYHYFYYRQGSMNIYLMKRLPSRWERHRRAVTVPCLAALATLAVALAAILFYYIIYLLATPWACLPYGALREIWR